MIVSLLLMLMFEDGPAKWEISDTEIYRPIVQREVAVDERGRVFLVNREQAVIMVYDQNGNRTQTLAGKGEGPGELQIPTWLHILGDKVYVEDAASRSISVFSTDGSYLSRMRWPDNDLKFGKVAGGWVYGDWNSSDDPSRPIRLFLADEQLENPKEIMHWPRPEENGSISLRSDGNSKPVLPINPAVEGSVLASSPDGEKVYLVRNNSDDIHVFNVAAGKWGTPVKTNNKPLPFNKTWGAEKVEVIKEGLPRNVREHVDVQPDFPDYFPLVRGFSVLSDGTLAMKLWSGTPDDTTPHLTFNGQGRKKTTPYSDDALTRVVAARGDWTYVTAYDADEEEARILCLPTSRVNQFVEDTPVVYDGLPGTAVVVSGR